MFRLVAAISNSVGLKIYRRSARFDARQRTVRISAETEAAGGYTGRAVGQESIFSRTMQFSMHEHVSAESVSRIIL